MGMTMMNMGMARAKVIVRTRVIGTANDRAGVKIRATLEVRATCDEAPQGSNSNSNGNSNGNRNNEHIYN